MNQIPYNRSKYMNEEGVVRALVGNRAIVETMQKEACSGCSAVGACHAMGGSKERKIAAENRARAKVGDRVVLATPRRGVLGASFLLYMVPALALIAGAIVGEKMGPSWGMDSTGAAVLFGAAGLLVTGMGLRWLSARLEGHKSLAVAVVRVLGKGEADAVEQCASGV